ncbi:hypothetical protein [Chondrinema litorale]|uniref:hypothetical protein n=1 Tax=Chondrinema litorale TaxID=2994555 RepID=UPI002542828A|nr:hypothetical protein [Chondrinema litorale]UZS00063.1 hypothetical protein OQ292_39680 [Chondrinema litorale]
MNQMQNVSKMFDGMKITSICSVLSLVIVVVFMSFNKDAAVKDASGKAYIKTNSGTFSAHIDESSSVSIYEAKLFVKNSLRLAFAHNKHTFKENMSALEYLLQKKDMNRILSDFEKAEEYENYQRFDSRSEVSFDSISIDLDAVPIKGVCKFRRNIYFYNEQATIPTTCIFQLEKVDAGRSDNNPYGLRLKNIDYVDYIK